MSAPCSIARSRPDPARLNRRLQGCNQRAAHLAPSRAALRHKTRQGLLDARQVGHALPDDGEFLLGDAARLAAMGAVLQLQQRAHFVERETDVLRRLDELHP